jgi:heavy metal translocating P-type ATPase
MSRRSRGDYLLLGITLALLIGGGLARFFGANQGTSLLWGASGVIGLTTTVIAARSALKNREMGSDFLAALSLIGTLATNEYFAACVLSVMLATGRSLERWAEGQASRELESLISRVPRLAQLISESGEIHQIPVDDVRAGDLILVRSGDVVPIDGTLLGAAVLDESALTGEPMPVNREEGARVSSGVLNAGQAVHLVATSSAAMSTYAGIIRMVEEARVGTSQGVRLANLWAQRFVPLALILATIAGVISRDIHRSIAVLVAATPCPLILAVPVAIVAGMSNAAKAGAIIKGGAVLERLARAKAVMLDKTGTLTHGGPVVTRIHLAPGFDEAITLKLAASLDQASPHVVAEALVKAAQIRGIRLSLPKEVEEISGHAITGSVDGFKVKVGQPPTVLPDWAAVDESLLVAVEIDGLLCAIIGLVDPIRNESAETIIALRREGIERVVLVTGDREESATSVGNAVGVDEIHFRCTPADKMLFLKQEQARTKGIVVMIGDGINDAPALAAADVGVAMGSRGASGASEAADVVIVDDAIDRLATAIQIAKQSRLRALQSAGLGMTLSFIAMIFASVGLLTASEGAVVQEFIDSAAIIWALTALRSVGRVKPDKPTPLE